ncbi:MAG: hypothetical protein IPQ13_13750 [Holophagaceae bacterium]|nr:hypothetical protein [Holophagaceae bacterium]
MIRPKYQLPTDASGTPQNIGPDVAAEMRKLKAYRTRLGLVSKDALLVAKFRNGFLPEEDDDGSRDYVLNKNLYHQANT